MKIALPAYVEVKSGEFKSITGCTYAEIRLAQRLGGRQGQTTPALDRLIELNGATWKQFPLMTVGDMISPQ